MTIEISDLKSSEIAPYASLTERNLRQRELIIAESPKVILTAIENGMTPVSLLCEKKHISGDASPIISRFPELPVYTGKREMLAGLTGYTLTRGVLCAMKRREPLPADSILRDSSRICVIYDVCDTTNVGAIFRTAAALGFDGVLLSPETCDPFNRRSIRVSMGAVFQIRWAYANDVIGLLRQHSFESVSMALTEESVYLQDFAVKEDKKYAVILGSEGYGLPQRLIDDSDTVVKIPMYHGVDSLNVGAAAAITLWHFRKKEKQLRKEL